MSASSQSFILVSGRLQLRFPLQNAGAPGRSFGLGNVSCLLERNRQGSVGKWIIWSQGRQRESSANGLFKPTGIAQGADKSMMGLNVIRINRHCRAKALNGLGSGTGCELVEPPLREGFRLV